MLIFAMVDLCKRSRVMLKHDDVRTMWLGDSINLNVQKGSKVCLIL